METATRAPDEPVELDEALTQEIEVNPGAEMELPDDHPDRFRIEDDQQAQWALRKLAQFAKRQAEAQTIADKEIRKITEWLNDRKAKVRREVEFFESLLVEYHREVLKEDPKRKTISLPAGKIKARLIQGHWVFDDEEFLAWAEDHAPELVRVRKEIDKNQAKKQITRSESGPVIESTGEKVDGLEIHEGGTRFYVEVTP